MPLIWTNDAATANVAANGLGLINAVHFIVPAPQFPGKNCNTASMNKYVVHGAYVPAWGVSALISSPANIINMFINNHNLVAVALIASWGTMFRTAPHIWGKRNLADIDAALNLCRHDIIANGNIATAWEILTNPAGNVRWSAVMASKTLHFLCRALGFNNDSPAALDNAVIRQRFWPAFRNLAVATGLPLPGNWNGNSYAAYLRYMTAINIMATARGWTTTEMECTIFDQY